MESAPRARRNPRNRLGARWEDHIPGPQRHSPVGGHRSRGRPRARGARTGRDAAVLFSECRLAGFLHSRWQRVRAHHQSPARRDLDSRWHPPAGTLVPPVLKLLCCWLRGTATLRTQPFRTISPWNEQREVLDCFTISDIPRLRLTIGRSTSPADYCITATNGNPLPQNTGATSWGRVRLRAFRFLRKPP